jgi:hypothetical protein
LEQLKNKAMDIKKQFEINNLVTGFKYIDSLESEYNTSEDYYKALHYMQWLHETKLTPKLIKELFEDVKIEKYTCFDTYTLGSIDLYYSNQCYENWAVHQWSAFSPRIHTEIMHLADLARLTKDKPIPFR